MTEYRDLLVLAKEKANEIIREVNDSLPSPMTVPVPINRVVKMYVGDVTIHSIPFHKKLAGVSAFAKKDMETGWVIVVDASESLQRRRFSVAHELGHIVLFPKMDPVFHNPRRRSFEETICNRFAGNILMPDVSVRVYYQRHPKPFIESVAECFSVSPLVAGIQLKRLGLPFRKIGRYLYI